MTSPTEWARHAARMIIERHGDASAVDTADYRECGFIIAAATVALANESFAAAIGDRMEPKRSGDHDGEDAAGT
jgi:hypothetical protein